MSRHRPGRRTRKRTCWVCGKLDSRTAMVQVDGRWYHERCSTFMRFDTLPPETKQ